MHVDELSAIPQASREIALQRFEMLRPHIEGVRSLRGVASEASIPYRTAVRWARGYRKHGLVALARKSRSDQGERRLASTQLISKGLRLSDHHYRSAPYTVKRAQWQKTLQERKPSYAVVHRIVRNLPAGLLMLAHRDNKA
jgi:putative transposase